MATVMHLKQGLGRTEHGVQKARRPETEPQTAGLITAMVIPFSIASTVLAIFLIQTMN